MFEDGYFFLPKVCSTTPYKIIGFYYIYIFIYHKGTIGLWSNRLTKSKEKIEQWVHSYLILNNFINAP